MTYSDTEVYLKGHKPTTDGAIRIIKSFHQHSSYPEIIETQETATSTIEDEEYEWHNEKPNQDSHAIDDTDREARELRYWNKKKRRSLAVIYSVVALAWANLTVLQSTFPRLQFLFGFTPSQRGFLVTARVFSMFITLPIYGWIADRFMSRRILLTLGLAAWTLSTFCHIFVTTYTDFFIVSWITGAFMGVATPLTRSLISHYFSMENRGIYFGYVEVSSGIGGAIGVFLGSSVSSLNIQLGPFNSVHIVFLILSLLTFPFIFLAYYLVVDPVKDPKAIKRLRRHRLRYFPGLEGFAPVHFKDVKILFRCKTWVCLVAQGMFGSVPWTGLSYLINWFQVMKVETTLAAFLFIMVAGSAAIGGAIGGFLGDKAQRWQPRWGRILVSQFSVVLGIPIACILILAIPRDPANWYIYLIVGVTFGASISWPPPNNCAITGDVIVPHLMSTAFSLQYMIEGSIGAWGTTFVGVIAETFYGVKNIESSSPLPNEINDWLDGLGNSILLVAVVPWIACSLCYVPMYFFYPKESFYNQRHVAASNNPHHTPLQQT